MRTPTSRVVLHEIQTNHIKKKYGIKFSVSTIRQTLQLFQKNTNDKVQCLYE